VHLILTPTFDSSILPGTLYPILTLTTNGRAPNACGAFLTLAGTIIVYIIEEKLNDFSCILAKILKLNKLIKQYITTYIANQKDEGGVVSSLSSN